MILAAGLGTRLKPFTDKHPKALATVNNETLLQRNIRYLMSYGISDIIINVHHFADQIRDHVKVNNGFGARITFSDETDEVLETGGGLQKASWFLKNSDPFVLMNVDVLTDMNLGRMIEEHERSAPVATLAVSERETSRYFLFDKSGWLCGWENIKTKEQRMSRPATEHVRKAFSGIHIVSPAIFDLIEQRGRFSMVDVYLKIAGQHSIMGFDHTGSKFIDVGKPESIGIAEGLFM